MVCYGSHGIVFQHTSCLLYIISFVFLCWHLVVFLCVHSKLSVEGVSGCAEAPLGCYSANISSFLMAFSANLSGEQLFSFIMKKIHTPTWRRIQPYHIACNISLSFPLTYSSLSEHIWFWCLKTQAVWSWFFIVLRRPLAVSALLFDVKDFLSSCSSWSAVSRGRQIACYCGL